MKILRYGNSLYILDDLRRVSLEGPQAFASSADRQPAKIYLAYAPGAVGPPHPHLVSVIEIPFVAGEYHEDYMKRCEVVLATIMDILVWTDEPAFAKLPAP